MSLFNFGKKPAQSKPAKKQIELHHYDFVLAKGFRGFKTYPMVVYGDKTSEDNNRYFFDAAFPGKKISFVEDITTWETVPRIYFHVMLENKKIGAIFEEDQVDAMRNGIIEAVYAKPYKQVVVGPGSYEERPRIHVYVKYRGDATK